MTDHDPAARLRKQLSLPSGQFQWHKDHEDRLVIKVNQAGDAHVLIVPITIVSQDPESWKFRWPDEADSIALVRLPNVSSPHSVPVTTPKEASHLWVLIWSNIPQPSDRVTGRVPFRQGTKPEDDKPVELSKSLLEKVLPELWPSGGRYPSGLIEKRSAGA